MVNLMMKTKSNYFICTGYVIGSYVENAAIYMLFAIVRPSTHFNKVGKKSSSTNCDGGHGFMSKHIIYLL